MIKELEATTRRDMKKPEARLLQGMKDIKYHMIIKLGALTVVAVSAMATLQKIL